MLHARITPTQTRYRAACPLCPIAYPAAHAADRRGPAAAQRIVSCVDPIERAGGARRNRAWISNQRRVDRNRGRKGCTGSGLGSAIRTRTYSRTTRVWIAAQRRRRAGVETA
jgi:hypothetical protein